MPLAVLAAGTALYHATKPRPAYLPDPRLTPGEVVFGVDRGQTCDPAWTHRSRDVPESLRLAVFHAYGLAGTPAQRQASELDHRVPVALGGASTVRNVWVEPWDGTWGAHVKDKLENALYRDVCAGRVTLRDAQAVFLGDWTAEYIRRFGDPAQPKVGAMPGGSEEFDTEGFGTPKD